MFIGLTQEGERKMLGSEGVKWQLNTDDPTTELFEGHIKSQADAMRARNQASPAPVLEPAERLVSVGLPYTK